VRTRLHRSQSTRGGARSRHGAQQLPLQTRAHTLPELLLLRHGVWLALHHVNDRLEDQSLVVEEVLTVVSEGFENFQD